jgi:nitrogen fixation NifU-like protein
MPFYSDKVMDHFSNPRNVGELKDADGIGEVGNPVCGDMMTFYIKVKDGKIEDVKFKTFGCGAAIAVSSMVSEMAIGKTIDEALAITNAQVAKELGGLPPNKMHCSNLGADALHRAIEDYKKKGQAQGDKCACPFCVGDSEGCMPCKTTPNDNVKVCSSCGAVYSSAYGKCPSCGTAPQENKR